MSDYYIYPELEIAQVDEEGILMVKFKGCKPFLTKLPLEIQKVLFEQTPTSKKLYTIISP